MSTKMTANPKCSRNLVSKRQTDRQTDGRTDGRTDRQKETETERGDDDDDACLHTHIITQVSRLKHSCCCVVVVVCLFGWLVVFLFLFFYKSVPQLIDNWISTSCQLSHTEKGRREREREEGTGRDGERINLMPKPV